jgi:hypothetical protein
MKASRTRLAVSRELCLSTVAIIREARETIDRTLERLGVPSADLYRQKRDKDNPDPREQLR